MVFCYSLADSKTNMLAMAIESRLKEIRDVLNSELIPFLFRLNGWREEQYLRLSLVIGRCRFGSIL